MIYLRGDRRRSSGLGEVRAHVPLEVEVCELIGVLELEESRELGVGVDFASIGLVLKVIRANVSIDVTGNLSARHLGSRRLLEEAGKLITDLRGLDESGRGAVSSLALALSALLLGRLELTSPLLLEGAVLGAEGGNEGSELLELREELSRLIGKGINIDWCGSLLNNRGNKGQKEFADR